MRVIVAGLIVPTKTHADGKKITIAEADYSDDDWKKIQLNAKLLNILHYALDVNEYNRISTCISAKQVWDKLEVTYEGINQVKESKINLLWRDYELFFMKPDETRLSF